MKKILTLIFALTLTFALAFSLVACGKGNDDDGEPPKLDEPLTEAQWLAAFAKFENVTVNASYGPSDESVVEEVTIKIFNGTCHIYEGGELVDTEPPEATIFLFDFSEQFAKFDFDEGVYSLKNGEVAIIAEDAECSSVLISFNANKEITHVEYITTVKSNGPDDGDGTPSEDVIYTVKYSFDFFNYGTTSAESGIEPDEDPGKDDDAPENPDAGKEPESGNGYEVTADKWADAFNFTNVTVAAQNLTPGVPNPNATFKIVDGMFYISTDGTSFKEVGALSGEHTAMFNFSTQFSKFEFKDGAYTLKSGESATITMGMASANCAPVTVKFNKDSKITYLAYSASDGTYDASYIYEFSAYGTTVKPAASSGNSGTSGGSSSSGGTSGGNSSNTDDDVDRPSHSGFEVNENEWISAFRPANVTVNSRIDFMGMNMTSIIKICDGESYASRDGEPFERYGNAETAYEDFDFANYYSKFEFDGTAYRLKDGEVINTVLEGADVTYSQIVVRFRDFKLVAIEFNYSAEYNGQPVFSATYNVIFDDYGTTTKPIMSGGDSSNPQIHKPPIATRGAEVTQKQWSEAFRPANVTVYTCADTSEGIMVALGIICDGKTYSSEDGVNFTEDEETPEDIYADMPFSNFYDKFEYHDGTYVLKSGESILHSVENDITTVLRDVSIMFNEEGQLVRINYSIYVTMQGYPEIPGAVIESIFFGHGETVVPEIDSSTDGDEGSGNTNIPDNSINENETERSEIPAVSTGSLK